MEPGTKSEKQIKAARPASAAIFAFLLFVIVNIVSAPYCSGLTQALNAETIRRRSEESRQEGTWSFWIARNFLLSPRCPDVVLFGSSLIGSATFSADAITAENYRDCVLDRRAITLEKEITHKLGQRPEIFNASLPGSMASDAYMISKALFRADHKPRMVIIGINPRDFIDNTLNAPSDTDPFHFFAPYVPLKNLSRVAFSDVFAYLEWSVDQYVPLKRLNKSSGEILRAMSANDGRDPVFASAPKLQRKEQSLLKTILGGSSDVRAGEWLIPYPMPYGFIDNTSEYLRRYKRPDPPMYQAQRQFFRAFLQYMSELDVKVLVVNMPSTKPNRDILPDSFWTDFKGFLASTSREFGGQYADLSSDNRFVSTDYLDTVHLNGAGGQKLFRAMAESVAEAPPLRLSISPVKENGQTRSELKTTSSVNSWR